MDWIRTIVELHYIMVDSRKLQRKMSCETGYSFERNTGFLFRIISAKVLFFFFRNSSIPSIMMIWCLSHPHSFIERREKRTFKDRFLLQGEHAFEPSTEYTCSHFKRSNLK